MSKKHFCIAAMMLVGQAGAALAQTPGVGVEIEPYIGAYVPFSDVFGGSVGGTQVTATQKEGFALGGRILFKLGGAMGIEGNFLYALSDQERETSAGTTTEDAYAWTADARLHLMLLPLGGASIHATGGVAAIGHGGDGWEQVVDGDTDVAGVLGAGLKFGLGPLKLRGDADFYLYSVKVTVDSPTSPTDVELESEVQTDMVLSAGLVLSY